MTNRLKHILTTVCFCAVIGGLAIACLLHPVAANSEAERRPLAQMPELKADTVESGLFFSQFDDYTVDQFPARDFFRSIKAHFQMSVLHTKENNSLAVENGYIAKINTTLNLASLENAAKKFQTVFDTYLTETDTNNYLAVVPDKGLFFAEDFGYPSIDYTALVEYMSTSLSEFDYIDLWDELSLDDYYHTDTHWRQENLLPVAKKLAEGLNVTPPTDNYTVNEHFPFNGVYAGQSALNPTPDTLCYLTNDTLEKYTVYDFETGDTLPIYNTAKLDTAEPYDVFLSGTKALLRIDNPNAASERELIVFRDSYGASLIPLLAESYRSITLVDLRYVNTAYLDKYIEFTKQDVLFLYSTLLLNDSFALK